MKSDDPVTSEARPVRVLVVDDVDENRVILRMVLERQGYEVHEEADGKAGLEAARRLRPAVVLMDVIMPRMTGIEATRAIRADPGISHTPVLLITSLTDRESRLAGIGAGASDFLNKPMDAEDVVLRVRNAVQLMALHAQVRKSLDEVTQLTELRDKLVHMLVHDLKAPLATITGYLDNLEAFLGDRLQADERLCLDAARQGALNLVEMIHSMLDVNRLECGQLPLRPVQVEVAGLARDALRDVGVFDHRATIDLDLPPPFAITCDADGIRRVLVNLLHNAVKFTPASGRVTLSAAATAGGVRFSVRDTGPGIPPEHRERVFDKFFQAAQREDRLQFSSGLGLTFCKLMVEAHGGTIGVASEPGRGTEVWFTLPARAPRE